VHDVRDLSRPRKVWEYFDREGRFGAHNIVEHIAADGPLKDVVFITYFNAGLRAVDVSDALQPREVGFAPMASAKSSQTISEPTSMDGSI
jgi:hypothetical protein